MAAALLAPIEGEHLNVKDLLISGLGKRDSLRIYVRKQFASLWKRLLKFVESKSNEFLVEWRGKISGSMVLGLLYF